MSVGVLVLDNGQRIALAAGADGTLTARIAAMFSRSVFDLLMEDPKWRDAAARGRRIHEDALRLAESREIPYEEAIRRLVDGGA